MKKQFEAPAAEIIVLRVTDILLDSLTEEKPGTQGPGIEDNEFPVA